MHFVDKNIQLRFQVHSWLQKGDNCQGITITMKKFERAWVLVLVIHFIILLEDVWGM